MCGKYELDAFAGNVIDPQDLISGITLGELQARLEKDTNLDQKEMEKAKSGQRLAYPEGIIFIIFTPSKMDSKIR